jgi:hypothetical protein
MATKSIGSVVVVAAIVVTIVGLGYPGVMGAFNPQPDPPGTEKFPPIGITATETGRLNVANTRFLGESSERPCAVALQIFDPDGNVLAAGTKLLRARQTAFIEIAGLDVLAGRDSLRAEIWAAAVPSGDKSCQLATSFELIDNATARTSVALGGPDTTQ